MESAVNIIVILLSILSITTYFIIIVIALKMGRRTRTVLEQPVERPNFLQYYSLFEQMV
jgi:hypothetical protein